MPFDKVKKNLGFGCMRMKMTDGKVDYPEFEAMIDRFLEAGFNYFDTSPLGSSKRKRTFCPSSKTS